MKLKVLGLSLKLFSTLNSNYTAQILTLFDSIKNGIHKIVTVPIKYDIKCLYKCDHKLIIHKDFSSTMYLNEKTLDTYVEIQENETHDFEYEIVEQNLFKFNHNETVWKKIMSSKNEIFDLESKMFYNSICNAQAFDLNDQDVKSTIEKIPDYNKDTFSELHTINSPLTLSYTGDYNMSEKY